MWTKQNLYLIISQTLQNSCGVFIHHFAPHVIYNQVFFFQKNNIKMGDFPQIFFLKAKFKLEKNEKKIQKKLLICNVCQRRNLIKSLNSKNNVFCSKKLLPWNLWPQSNDIHKWTQFF
jgi:hypothetical protein